MILFRTKYFFPLLTAFGILIFTGFSGVSPERLPTDFLTMEGNRVTHYFEEPADSLSGSALIELQDESGLPVWFCRYVFKDVCISGECKMIRLWLFWDGAGNYLGLQIPEDEPLTKSDHTPFEPEDYRQLESILLDTASILNTLEQDDLIVVPDSIDPYEVDGYTAATQPTLAEVVVKDAVFTCYTLWHTVYGPVQNEIFNILNQRADREYLSKMFDSAKPEYNIWAVQSVGRNPAFHQTFYPRILEYIKADDSALVDGALDYFNTGMLADTVIQQQLTGILADADMSVKYKILWKFIAFGKINERSVLDLLEMFSEQKIGVGAYNLILRLVLPEFITKNGQVAQKMQELSAHENAYVRNLSKKAMKNRE